MSSSGNTIGILVPQPSAPAMVSQGSANPPEPLTNAAGPVDVIEMVADVASSALSLVAPESAAANVQWFQVCLVLGYLLEKWSVVSVEVAEQVLTVG